MVRLEVKSFMLELNSGSVMLSPPFSLASAVDSGVVSLGELGETVTFTAEVETDAIALSMKNIYLKLGRLSAPCDVLVNGTVVGRADGEHLSYVFNASEALKEGENKLSLVFDSKCDPRDVGVFSPVEIVRFNNAIIDKVTLNQKHDGGAVTVGIRVDLLGNTENVRAVATLTSPVGQMYYAGLTRGKGSITIPDPLYWWPHGHGVQNLYKVTVNLYGEVDIEDTAEMRIGLRTVETLRSLDGSALSVNGASILPMGAVYRPERDLSLYENAKRIDAFITYAAMANYNTVVIPVGSTRPIDKFYELCDLHGIMVIEEISEVSPGYLDTLERISHHPSLALVDIRDGSKVLEITDAINLASPELGFSIAKDFAKYSAHPSLPCTKTLNSAISRKGRNPTSREMEKISDTQTTSKMLAGIVEKYPYPAGLEDLSYVSQLAQASKISGFIKTMRLSEGAAGRAVFDGLGDSKIVASPSAIDSAARRKALGFYAHKFFSPIALYADNDNGKILFSVSSQRKLDFSGTLEYRIADAKNVTIYRNTEELEFEGMSTKKLFTRDLSEYIKGHEQEYYLEYILRESTSVIYSDVLLFVPEKHFAFEDPDISFDITGSDKRFSITLTAKAFAKDVELCFDGVDGVLSDNYVCLTQNSPIKLTLNVWSGIETARNLKNALEIRSIYDLI